MKRAALLFSMLVISLSACGPSQHQPDGTQVPTIIINTLIPGTEVPDLTLESETLQAIPTFTPLPGPCATPAPGELNDFIKSFITIEDSGKTFVTHITSRFWIYLDDRIYPLRDLSMQYRRGLSAISPMVPSGDRNAIRSCSKRSTKVKGFCRSKIFNSRLLLTITCRCQRCLSINMKG